LLGISCGRNPEDARKELGRMNVEYSSGSLMKSIRNGDTVTVKLFIEAGMPLNEVYEMEDPNTNNKIKTTPLILSLSRYGKIEIANLLLDSGADVNKYILSENTQKVKVTPLSLAFGQKLDEQQKNALIMKIIEKGADVNVGFEASDKPLNWAIKNGDPEIVRAMIKRGAKVTDTALKTAEEVRNNKSKGNEIYEIVSGAK
jgi:ankyrin repeat protein